MGSLFSAPLPPGALPDRPITPDPFDPQVEAMRRKRLKKLKRHIPRQATILTAGLGERTQTIPQPGTNRALPGAPVASRRESTILTAGIEARTERGPTPAPGQPQQPTQPPPQEPMEPKPDPCEAILETLLQLNRELDEIRPKISRLKFRITANEEEIERLKSAPVELPPIPGRLPRRPIKLRKQIPDAIKDAEQARRSIDIFEKRKRIRVLEREIEALKRELKPLEEEEGRLRKNQPILEKRLADCRAANT